MCPIVCPGSGTARIEESYHVSRYALTTQPSPRKSWVTISSEGFAHENMPRMLTSGSSMSAASARAVTTVTPRAASFAATEKWSAWPCVTSSSRTSMPS